MIIVVCGVNKYIWYIVILDILVLMGKMVVFNVIKCICYMLKMKVLVVLIVIFLLEKVGGFLKYVLIDMCLFKGE